MIALLVNKDLSQENRPHKRQSIREAGYRNQEDKICYEDTVSSMVAG